MSEGATKRLLVVDDEKPIRQLLARIAQRAGFEVDTARDGVEALEKLGKSSYAIVIVDLMMPRLSGYELVEKISRLVPRPVVLVATALANGDVASLDDSMVRSVIKKPFDINAVARALIDTAAQIAEKQALDAQAIPVAAPEVATIPILPDEDEPAAAPPIVREDEEEGPPPPEPTPLKRR